MKSQSLVLMIVVSVVWTIPLRADHFKAQQLKYPRVRRAYRDKADWLEEKLAILKINRESLEIFLRAFKQEKLLQVWIRDKNHDSYVHFKDYDFCASSGVLGPKRRQGDLQIPEGFYFIDRFNAWSNFFLSLGINYPNSSDRIKATTPNPGGDIFIHGDCVTIGCIPITDDKIKELYILAVEAHNNGQRKIPVHIFPARLNNDSSLFKDQEYASRSALLVFWKNLKISYDYFEEKKRLLNFHIDRKGEYIYNKVK